MLNLNLSSLLDRRSSNPAPSKAIYFPESSHPSRRPSSPSAAAPSRVVSPSSVNETRSFHPTSKLPASHNTLWSRLLKGLTTPRPMVHRFLPKVKSGRLLLEVGDKSAWKHFEVVLAGASMGDLGLYYYAAKSDASPMGCILLHSAHIDVLEEVIMVVTQERTWFLCAEHGRDASEWAETICATIERITQGVLLLGKPPSPSGTSGSTGSLSSGKRRRLSGNASAGTLREIQSREPRTRVDEFLEVFVRSTPEDIRLQATEGALSWSCMRNVTWKVWLEVIPSDLVFQDWIPTLRIKRERYETLRQQHCASRSPFSEHCTTLDDEAFIQTCESTEDTLLYAIYKDVRRTRGTMTFFRDPSLQCQLIRILYTYSCTHPEISYNQGMGELLATLVYLLHIEQWPSAQQLAGSSRGMSTSISSGSLATKSTSTRGSTDSLDSLDASYVYVDSFIDIQDDATYLDRERFLSLLPFTGGSGKYLDCCREAAEEILQEMTSASYMEHDAYLLLEEIMIRMAGAYCPDVHLGDKHSPRCTSSVTPPSEPLAHPASRDGLETTSSPLYEQMNSIHHQILSRCDPPTARHLASLGVEPQMFVLRWVRVLMSREFDMAQVWQIWDAIFSLTPSDFSFINLLCVAAVREFRDEILQVDDPTAVLLCFREISVKVEADRLVDNAHELYNALLIAAAVEASSGAS